MSFGLEGKVVFISGGAGDIGTAIVKGFVEEKATVIIADMNVEAAQKLAAQWPEANVDTCYVNLTDEASIVQAAAYVQEKYGRVDVLLNVAGVLCRKSIFETEKSDFELSMSINVIGTFLLSQKMALMMKEQKSGTIINISSLNGTAAVENRAVYGATKAALNMTARSMALELGDYGVTVNTIAPGVVDSVMCRVRLDTEEKVENFCKYIPARKLTQPDEVRDTALFLASSRARGITGEVIHVDGGIMARQALPRG